MVSLMDLLNADLCRAMFLNGFFLASVSLLIAAGLRLPRPVALALTSVMRASSYGFLIYLTSGVVVQFAHVQLRRASVLDDTRVTDEAVQRGVKAAVTAASLALVAWVAGEPGANHGMTDQVRSFVVQ